MRRITIALAAVAALAVPATADDDLARLFPADTFAYVEVDAAAVEKGLPETQLLRILTDPRLKTLLKPGLARVGLDADKPAESILEHLRLRELLVGRAAVGIRGIAVVARDATGNETAFRIAPGTPVDARAVYRFFGLLTQLEARGGGKTTFDIDVDFLAAGRPGELGGDLIEQALASLGGEVTRTAVKVGDHDATHVRVDVPFFGNVTFGQNFYVAARDGMSLLATHRDVLAEALAGGPRLSLATNPSLVQARARLTSGRPVLLLHLDVALALDAVKGLLPPVVVEMGDINGLNSLRGVGLGVSLTEGGVRESFGILLDGNPRGMWKLLDALPTGLRSLEVAPPGALAAVAVKLDGTILHDRWRTLIAETLPGNEDTFEEAVFTEFAHETGLSLPEEILPALGDEAAIFLFPPRIGEMFPQAVVGFDARDEAAMSRLVAKLKDKAGLGDVRFTPVELPGGIAATRVTARVPYDLHFAVHKGHLFLATNGGLLAEVFAKWGAADGKCMRRDDEVLRGVLAGAGADPERLAALAYVNLRASGMEAFKTLPMIAGAGGLPTEWIDPKGLADFPRIPNHLTGVAVALSHDRDAFVLDCFSPVGMLLPTVATAVFFEVERQERRAQRMVAVAQRNQKASLGINQRSCDGFGVKIHSLADGGAAARAGLKPADLIVAIDGVEIKWIEELDKALEKRKPGESVTVTVQRGDSKIAVTVELGADPGDGW